MLWNECVPCMIKRGSSGLEQNACDVNKLLKRLSFWREDVVFYHSNNWTLHTGISIGVRYFGIRSLLHTCKPNITISSFSSWSKRITRLVNVISWWHFSDPGYVLGLHILVHRTFYWWILWIWGYLYILYWNISTLLPWPVIYCNKVWTNFVYERDVQEVHS